ncbi:MAG: hypothetical protein IK074_01345 [Bacteroidales bacterium]|nr:hypothetical protein [Bacteroidales bacterium]
MSPKTVRKICLIIAIVLAVLAVGGFVLSRIAQNRLRAVLATIPGGQIDFKTLHLSVIAGNVEVRDVEVALRDSTNAGPDINASMDAIRLEGVRWFKLLHGEALARRLVVRGGTIGMVNPNNSLKLSAQGINASVRDIGYLFEEERIIYNDSLYRVALDSLDFIDEKGLSRIQIGHFSTADAGGVEALGMHLYNCVPQEALAEKMGKVSVMWYDVKLDSLTTSPVNIPRMVLAQSVDIDRISLSGPEIVLLQDDRYAPPVPYPTFQESLNTIKMPLQIKELNANVRAFTFIWEITRKNRGVFPMHNLRLAIKSVSNAPNNQMELGIKSGRKGKGRLDLSVLVRNDKQESTRGRMQIFDLDAATLDPFMRPLFGATAKADIQKVDCQFKGNKKQMTGDFCMLYSNLSLRAWDDTTAPFQIVAKNSGAINFLANLAVPKSNPLTPGKDPKKVQVTFERDPWQPYPSYIIQNLTQGMLRTVLPGGSVSKPKKK